MPWIAGAQSGDEFYEVQDELHTPDGRCVAVLECFATSPDTYYCNAIDPQGNHHRFGASYDYNTVRDWAERVAGLKPLS